MVGVLNGAGTVRLRLSAVALGAAESLEKCDGDQTSGIRERGVACLVPFGVVFSTDDMEKIATGET